jgi:acylphosphatase
LGVQGSALNRPDGRVEVVACGEEQLLLQVREWLWRGPEGAQVTAVECEPLTLVSEPSDFSIG